MISIGQVVGRKLRDARTDRGLSLRDLEQVTDGRLRASSVAGYERGERRLSLETFVQLATVYGVRPDRLLAASLGEADTGGVYRIDLTRLTRIPLAFLEPVLDLVDEIKRLRGDETSVLTLRSGDLEALALSKGWEPVALLEGLGPSLIESGETERLDDG